MSVFFILFRETLETSIIVSVLLSWLKRTLGDGQDHATYKTLKRQVGLRIGTMAIVHADRLIFRSGLVPSLAFSSASASVPASLVPSTRSVKIAGEPAKTSGRAPSLFSHP